MEDVTLADRIAGCLLAGACGDALGAVTEFQSLEEIRARYGPGGLRDFMPAYGLDVAFTDDTQMTLFTAEGLLLARADKAEPIPYVWRAYQRWLVTQSGQSALSRLAPSEGWLLSVPTLNARRGPGSTCLSALSGGKPGSVTAHVNDSKGCGGVMRVAPVGLLSEKDAFEIGAATAALTHGHPSGYLSSGLFSFIIGRVVRGADLKAAVLEGLNELTRYKGYEETYAVVMEALELADRCSSPSAEIVETLGGGWIGEEAAAIAIYCALACTTLEEAVVLGANHSGDADSTASLAGQLRGAMEGTKAIPERWLGPLEGRDVIAYMAWRLAAAT